MSVPLRLRTRLGADAPVPEPVTVTVARVVRPDQREQFERWADDVVRVIDYFGARKAHIVGLSMGGRIAMDLVSRYPDRVATLTLSISGSSRMRR